MMFANSISRSSCQLSPLIVRVSFVIAVSVASLTSKKFEVHKNDEIENEKKKNTYAFIYIIHYK